MARTSGERSTVGSAHSRLRIAVGHDMQAALLAQQATDAVGGIGEHFQCAFHPPFGLRFARMLAGVEPDVERALAHFEAVDRLPVERVAEMDEIDAFRSGGF